jgi:acyl-phosphate glycerol 3-phosphate acyltransferase
MHIATTIGVAIGGYLIGSISFARIVASRVLPGTELGTTSLTWGEDDRGFVTENVSATSIRERGGTKWGCLTGIFDILKAAIPVAFLHFVFPDHPYDVVYGVAVVAGHNLPIYHGFKGGRGTSTVLGALIILDPISIPITILLGYTIGLFIFKDVLLAHHAGWIVLLPFWFALWARWDLVFYAVGINFFRWVVSGPELRSYWRMRQSGELQTREFHEAIEQSHIGYIHKYVRKWGWLRYDYMKQDG